MTTITERPAAAAPPETTGFVRLEGISKHYGTVRALDDVTLEIAKGEFLTLLGPSGSGKTTCLQAIAGLLTPSAGRLTIGGRDQSSVPMNRRNIGMVFQNYSLFPHLTVAQNVGYPLRVRRVGRAEAEERVARALEMVRLGAFGHRRPSELSGGQQQRVALARALVFGPDVLLLDEPLSALDRILREEMQLELRRIHRQTGMTMVCVTHDRTEALAMSDRVVIMRNGRIVQSATPEEIYRASGNRFVAEFLGEVNVLPMVLDADGRGARDARGRRLILERPVVGADGRIDVVIRVESARLEPAGAGAGDDDAPGRWRATVTDALFLGDTVRFELDCAPHRLILRLPLDQAAGFAPGTEVIVDLTAHPPMAFPAQD